MILQKSKNLRNSNQGLLNSPWIYNIRTFSWEQHICNLLFSAISIMYFTNEKITSKTIWDWIILQLSNSAPTSRPPKAFTIVRGNESAGKNASHQKPGSRSFLENRRSGKKKSNDNNSGRRRSLSDTFTISDFDEHGRFPVLPPLVRQEDPEGLRLGKLEAERRLSRILPEIPERTIDTMLRDLRMVDRDRDRILPSSQVAQMIKKYQVGKKWLDSYLLFKFIIKSLKS